MRPEYLMTRGQRSRLFLALRATASALGLSGTEEREDYRRRIMREELGVEHLSEVSRTKGYDALMARLAADRGDFEEAVRFGGGTVTRLHHLIGRAARQIVERRPDFKGSAWQYVAGVLIQSGLVVDTTAAALTDRLVNSGSRVWADLTEAQMKKVLMMLNSQLQRDRLRLSA